MIPLLLLSFLALAGTTSAPWPRQVPQRDLLSLGFRADVDVDAIYKICRNAIETQDLVCQNGGYLFATNVSASVNCAYCVCPDGWTGTDCSLCTSVTSCPAKTFTWDNGAPPSLVQAESCSVSTLEPTEEEFEALDGKTFSCFCGGDDPTTQWVCGSAPAYNWHFMLKRTVNASNATSYYLDVEERGGIPSMDQGFRPRFTTAYPQIWTGQFDGCRWRQGACEAPLEETQRCMFYECEGGAVQCPPDNVVKCPGWTTAPPYCGKVANTTEKYWQHNCNPLTYPMADLPVKLMCSLTPAFNNDSRSDEFQCYFSQEEAMMGALGMKCKTGSCLYNTQPPPPPSPSDDPSDDRPQNFAIKYPQIVTLITLATIFGSGVITALVLIKRDLRSSHRKFDRIASLVAQDQLAHSYIEATPSMRERRGLDFEAIREGLSEANGAQGRDEGEQEEEEEEREGNISSHATSRMSSPLPIDAEDEADVIQSQRRDQVRWKARFVAGFITGSGTHWETSTVPVIPTSVAWEDLTYQVINYRGREQTVLDHVCGSARPGGITAVMGPSGAGKTTLLDVLAGRKGSVGVRGTVRLNGHVVDASNLRHHTGYVEQTDVLPGTSTVLEHLMFHARLRIPGSGPEAQLARERRVWVVLEQFGLSKVANSYIGSQYVRGLSGGELRRVSLAAQMLTCPAVLLLDEPTSGLDATNASKVLELLAGVAAQGATVIMAIHQPRADMFSLIDAVSLLATGGRVVYHGPTRAMEAYVTGTLGLPPPPTKEINYADHLLDFVLKGDAGETQRLVTAYATSDVRETEAARTAAEIVHPTASPPRNFQPSFFQQLGPLSVRQLREVYRHPLALLLNLTATLVVALALGLVFFRTGVNTGGIQNRFGCLYFILIFLSLMSISSLPVWTESRLLFQRERSGGIVEAPAYLTTAFFFEALPMRVLPPFFFVLITYYMVGLHPQSATAMWKFLLTLILSNLASSSTNMLIGASVHSAVLGNVFASLVILLLMIFGGFLLNKNSVPEGLGWISFLSYFNYAYEALAINEFHDSPLEFVFTTPTKSTKLPPLRTKGDGVLRTFGFDPSRFSLDVVALVIIFSATTFLAYLALSASDETSIQLQRRWRRAVWKGIRSIFLENDREEGGGPRGYVCVGTEPPTEHRGLSLTIPPRSESPTKPLIVYDELRIRAPQSPTPSSSMYQDVPVSPTSTSVTLTPTPSGGIARKLLAAFSFSKGARPGPTPAATTHRSHGHHHRMPAHPMVMSWEDISCLVTMPDGRKRRILRGVTGVAAPSERDRDDCNAPSSSSQSISVGSGCLFAVLGPSGSGKSTLLGILSGRKSREAYEGVIKLNGHAVSDEALRRAVGFVSQDDVLPGTSTVLEHLMFHARLRIPQGPGPSEGYRWARVEEVLEQMGLTHVKDSLIGTPLLRGLSGGELRRLSVAVALLTCPAVLLLDEPTSGLDATNASKVLELLAGVAAQGATVIMAIHQPRADVFRRMDRLLLLSTLGRPLYSGPVAQVPSFLHKYAHIDVPPTCNPADFLLDLAIKSAEDDVLAMEHTYQASDVRAADLEVIEEWTVRSLREPLRVHKHTAAWRLQFRYLCGRLLVNLWRDPVHVCVNILAAIAVSLFLGLLYWKAGRDTSGIQNRIGSLFFVTLHLAFMSLSSLPLWHQDKLLFLAESSAGLYSPSAYFLAQVLFDFLPLRLLPPIFFVSIAYPMIGYFPGALRSFRFLVITAVTNLAASSVNMALGAALDNLSAANLVGSLVMLLNILLGGFLLSRQLLPGWLKAVSQLSYLRYAFDALLINEFHGARGFRFTAFAPKGVSPDHVPYVEVTGDTILETFGFNQTIQHLVTDIVVLLAMTCGFLAIAFLVLRRKKTLS